MSSGIVAGAAAAASFTAMSFMASAVFAQTLTEPNPPTKRPPPQPVAKSPPRAAAKSCSAFGAGFVNIPGTDACVKVGGWVTVEGAAGR